MRISEPVSERQRRPTESVAALCTVSSKSGFSKRCRSSMAEQGFCKSQVVGSIPTDSFGQRLPGE